MSGKPYKLVNIDPEEIRKLYIAEGLTLEKTAEKLDVSVQSLKELMTKYEIQRRKRGPKPKKEDQIKCHADGKATAAGAGIRCTDAVMRTCIYANTNGAISCDYIGVTGHMRGCPTDHCTKYKKKEKSKRRSVWYEKNR